MWRVMLLGLVGMVFVATSEAKDHKKLSQSFPTRISVYDFTHTARFDFGWLHEIDIIEEPFFTVSPSGRIEKKARLQTADTRLSGLYDTHLKGGPSYYRELQRPALLEMLFRKYITLEMYQALEEAIDLWHPSQIRFAVTWSEMSLEQAIQLFGGVIPWERVINSNEKTKRPPVPTGWSPQQARQLAYEWPRGVPLRIVRSMVMVGVGQKLNPFAESGWVRQPMAWQKVSRFSDVASINQEAFPLTAEFSRAMAATGELPGSIEKPLEVLLSILEEEAIVSGIDPGHYALFARALDDRRSSYFARAFSMVVWDRNLADEFLQDPTAACARLASLPVVRKPEPDQIMMTTLARASSRLLPKDLSYTQYQLAKLSHDAISVEQARALHREFRRDVFSFYQFPDFPEQYGPVCVTDLTHLPFMRFAEKLVQAGVPERAMAELVQAIPFHFQENNFNAGSEYWTDEGIVVFADEGPGALALKDPRRHGIIIENITEAAVLAHPRKFLTAVLTSVYGEYQKRLAQASPFVLGNLANNIEDNFGTRLPFFEAFNLIIATTSKAVAGELIALGGKPEAAMRLNVPRHITFERVFSPRAVADLLTGGDAFMIRVTPEALSHLVPDAMVETTCSEQMARIASLQRAPIF